MTGHDPVAQEPLLLHAEVGAPVRDELVELVEGSGVREQIEAFARGELSALVLLLDALVAAAALRLPIARSKLLELALRPRLLQPHSHLHPRRGQPLLAPIRPLPQFDLPRIMALVGPPPPEVTST